ncbi:aldolase catalytic domain-containing protein [Pseudocalidococcus azoricus]
MIKLLDCTLRDGGYYNSWNFSQNLIHDYLQSMAAISVDYVELGFRGFPQDDFLGGCAYTTDTFIRSLTIPENLKIGVMVNASELIKYADGIIPALHQLFKPASDSPVSLVRIPCHYYEFEQTLLGCEWLKDQGYQVGINLMQVADRSLVEVQQLSQIASHYHLDVLYFADSMGSMNPKQTSQIIHALREGWSGDLGIHTHDNMGRALSNCVQAVKDGVTWIDGTVTGMGRGAGNVKTEYLVVELAEIRPNVSCNIIPLMELISNYFSPMQHEYGWGTNTYYYLAGKYGIHPTYIQEMLADNRYLDEDILGVIDHLKSSGGKRFSLNALNSARHFYTGEPIGTWSPKSLIAGRDVLILGTGPGVEVHQQALENFISSQHPIVIALNTQTHIASDLIDLRAACHPVRLLADCQEHLNLSQPLVIPYSMLSKDIRNELEGKELLDFGLVVQSETFKFEDNYCILPTSMVIAYSLAIATSGRAKKILLAGFDGYGSDDLRNHEMDYLLNLYSSTPGALPLVAITPTKYRIKRTSVYEVG